MLEQSMAIILTIWASLSSWFTPTTLFLFLNLTIATIAITSTLHKQPQNGQPQPLARSPSMLHRLKSINFNTFNNKHQDPLEEDQPPALSRSPSVLHMFKSINLYNYFSTQEPISNTTPTTHATQETVTHFPPNQEEEEEDEEKEEVEDLQDRSFEEIYSELKGSYKKQVARSKSDTKPTSGEVPPKLCNKMKKSASDNSAFSHFEENDVVETCRLEGHNGKLGNEVGDDEVDAKADAFINRFKQQLKLQRVDSILRYKEMLGRGSGK